MPQIDDFIRSVTKELGVSESAAQSGVGAVLQAVQQKADPGDFQELLSSIPGVSALLAKAPGGAAEAQAAGGGLGGVLSAASSLLGGGGGALGALSLLQGSGIPADKLLPFVSKLVEFAKSSAGEQLIGRILGRAPELAKLLGN